MQQLQEQPQTVDFQHYRSILRNQDVVNEMEREMRNYKAKTYDVDRQIKAIEVFETQAVKSAEETKGMVEAELRDLEKTLKNIEEARPFTDLTVVCIDEITVGEIWLIDLARTRLQQRGLTLTRRQPSWCPEDAGMCQATGYVEASVPLVLEAANDSVGEIRRPFYRLNLWLDLHCTIVDSHIQHCRQFQLADLYDAIPNSNEYL